MPRFAALARQLLDRLDIARADVLGLSFGGLVAQQLARDAPTRVRGLVLVSTSCGLGGVPSNPASWWYAMLSGVWPTSGGQGPQRLVRRWSRVLLRELGAGWAAGPGLGGFAEQIAAASLWSSLPWLPRLTQETLVITGTADPLVPAANASILASRMPRAQIYRVHGGGHMCLLDRAAEVGPCCRRLPGLARAYSHQRGCRVRLTRGSKLQRHKVSGGKSDISTVWRRLAGGPHLFRHGAPAWTASKGHCQLEVVWTFC